MDSGISKCPVMSAGTFNPFTPAYIADPFPQLHELQRVDPVHHSKTLGVWLITRYADVMAALRDPRFSSVGEKSPQFQRFFLRGGPTSSPLGQLYSRFMLQKDPPDHTRLRALVNKAFTVRVAEGMRPRISALVDELIALGLRRGEMDLMSELAFPLPTYVICDLLGVPREDYPKIQRWSIAMLTSLSPAVSAPAIARVNEAIVEFQDYFRALARQRAASPREDLLTALLAASEQQDRLSEDELIATCMLLAFAGHATTTQTIGKGLQFLLQHPDQLQALRQDPSLIGNAIEEILRFEAPLQILYRTTTEAVTIEGRTIPANEMVFLSLAAANRDPAQFPEPNRFDIRREQVKHVSFAYGIHYCAGAPLARIEAQIAINTVVQRLSGIELKEEKIRREPSLLLRGLTSLPVTFDSVQGKEAA